MCKLQCHIKTNNTIKMILIFIIYCIVWLNNTSIFDYFVHELKSYNQFLMFLYENVTKIRSWKSSIPLSTGSTINNYYFFDLSHIIQFCSNLLHFLCKTFFFTKLIAAVFFIKWYCIIMKNKDELDSRHRPYRSPLWLSCKIHFSYHSMLQWQLQ